MCGRADASGPTRRASRQRRNSVTRGGAAVVIPLTLNVRNFMSYTDVHEPLRFEGIHVAVLTGDNGHGKSALLDAITWALWGRARAPLRRRADPHRRLRDGGRVRVRARRAAVPRHSQAPAARHAAATPTCSSPCSPTAATAADRALGQRDRAADRAHPAHELRDVHQLVVHPAGPRRQLHHQLAGRAQAHPGRDPRAGLLRRAGRPRQGTLQDARGAAGRRAPAGAGLGRRRSRADRSTRPSWTGCAPSCRSLEQRRRGPGAQTTSARERVRQLEALQRRSRRSRRGCERFAPNAHAARIPASHERRALRQQAAT